MNNQKFSLIIAIDHNDKNYRDIVKSAQEQNYSNLEILIISNRLNSKDQYILDYLVLQDNLNRCQHLSFISRRCKASLYNEGIACATGDYFWCIDENIHLNSKLAITKIMEEMVNSKAQVMHLPQENQVMHDEGPELRLKAHLSFEHPQSLINQKDWQNQNRFVIKRKFVQLFNLHFEEGWPHINGSLMALQIIRFMPNIYYSKKNPAQFTNCKSSFTSRQLVDQILSFNYTLRYAEIIFGTDSSIFRNILKEAIEDRQEIFPSIDNLVTTQAIKDYLKSARKIILDQYIKSNYEDAEERADLHNKVNSLAGEIKSSYSKMLNEFFQHSKIKVHCGAHKTATTYIQNALFEARYDLALNNNIYIHHEQFRDDISKSDLNMSIKNLEEKIAFSIFQQASILSFKAPNILIISEENLIRPNPIISINWNSDASHQTASNYTCACIRGGYNLGPLRHLSNIFNHGIEIIYTVRNYFDYLLSRHSEFLKWRPFKEFDGEFVNENDLLKCDWDYLISDLKRISSLTSIFAFEIYKNNPLQLANYLCEYDISEYLTKQIFNQSINRSRSSQSLLDEMINKKNLGYQNNDLQSIFSKKIEFESSSSQKFNSKLFPNSLLKKSKTLYAKKYISTESKLTIDNLEVLSKQKSCERKRYEILKASHRPLTFQKRNSDEQKLTLEQLKEKSLFLDGRKHSALKSGVSAMIKSYNRERVIYNVLDSIKNCFHELVIIDNNSSDDTVAEINRFIDDNQSLKNKIHLHHYKFKVAKYGVYNFKEPQNSPHSLASFNNYGLKKCSYNRVCTWDSDMILPKLFENNLKLFLNKVLTAKPSCAESAICGIIRGLTVYKGYDENLYYRKLGLKPESIIFENIDGIFFAKDIWCEQLYSLYKLDLIGSENLMFVKFKDTRYDEYSNLSSRELSELNLRIGEEVYDFDTIKRITRSNSIEGVVENIQAYGFQKINFNIENSRKNFN